MKERSDLLPYIRDMSNFKQVRECQNYKQSTTPSNVVPKFKQKIYLTNTLIKIIGTSGQFVVHAIFTESNITLFTGERSDKYGSGEFRESLIIMFIKATPIHTHKLNSNTTQSWPEHVLRLISQFQGYTNFRTISVLTNKMTKNRPVIDRLDTGSSKVG